MNWYIKAGESIKRDQRVFFEFYRCLAHDYTQEDLIFVDHMIQCEEVQPPRYPQKGVTKINCTLTSDLRKLDRKYVKRKTSPSGKMYFEVMYNLVITLKAAVMKFSLEVSGHEMGSVEAEYE